MANEETMYHRWPDGSVTLAEDFDETGIYYDDYALVPESELTDDDKAELGYEDE